MHWSYRSIALSLWHIIVHYLAGHYVCTAAEFVSVRGWYEQIAIISPLTLLLLKDTYIQDSRLVPSQLETALLCNDVSHLLGASLESVLYMDLCHWSLPLWTAMLPIKRKPLHKPVLIYYQNNSMRLYVMELLQHSDALILQSAVSIC